MESSLSTQAGVAKFGDDASQMEAIRKVQAVAEFSLEGIFLVANQNYLTTFGYTLEELQGKHHSVIVDEKRRVSQAYRDLWSKLNRGESEIGSFVGVAKGGRRVWIQASFCPVFDAAGKPVKILQLSSDITGFKLTSIDTGGQVSALRKSLCVIEYGMDCKILNANKNMLAVLGYREEELVGKHASSLMSASDRKEGQCEKLWSKLSKGEHQAGQFHWVGKDGKEAILEVSLNPILDLNEEPFKVVLIAQDITRQMHAVETMMADAAMLSEAALHGQLAVRASLERHEGAFRKIIDGVNGTLDTVVAPLRMAAESAGAMASSSEELSVVSQQMADNAEQTAMQANVAAAAAEQISRNIGSVAAAAQEMQASISEISRNANESARVAQGAVATTEAANQTISKLGESSSEIGKVIKVITGIAQQTNLLALNATIESARAGEAGKGFAVVANEVKELAKQTAKATEEIGQKIEAIQADTSDAVKAIEQISGIIHSVNGLSNSIASAVEEQTVTTNEIGRSVNEAAHGVDEIAGNIGKLATAAKETTEGASHTQLASNELSRMAGELQAMVAKFTF